jgi:outer membrane protein assembly factor BamB
MTLPQGLTLPPAYEGNSAYMQIDSGQLAAYDLTSGTARWVAAAQPLVAPAVGDDLVFVEQQGELAALDKGDGTVRWKTPLASKLTAPPAGSSGIVTAASGADVMGLHTADGTAAWTRDIPGPVHDALAADADRVYLPTSDGRVMALRLDTGETVWERRLGAAAHGLLISGERLFLGAVDNFFYCLNTRDGRIEWRWRTGADVVNRPILDRSRVYFVSYDNVVRALNQRNGVQQWKRGLNFRPAYAPIKAGDTLILTGLDGPPQAFLLKDGTPAGQMALDPGSEIVAPMHTFDAPGLLGPAVITITRRFVSTTSVTITIMGSRSIDPIALPSLAPLPGVIPMSGAPRR